MAERGVATADRISADMTADERGRYWRLVTAITAQALSFGRDGVPAERAATVIAKAASTSRPRTRYTVGRDSAVLVRLAGVMPDRVMDAMLRLSLRPHYAGA